MDKSFLKNVKISKNLKKPIFSANYQLDIEICFDSNEEILKIIVEKFRQITEHLPLKNNLLENIQGRDNQDLKLNSGFPFNQDDKELLLIAGEYKESPDDEISSSFTYRLHTNFHSFSGKTKIYNSLVKTQNNLDEHCSLESIISEPLKYKITCVRFALEFFSARSLIPSFLLSPSVSEYFYFEGNLSRALIEIHSEDLKDKNDKPFSRREIPDLSSFVD